jgi:hypothetical protein
MAHWTSYRRHLAGALAAATLIVAASMATAQPAAQPTEQQARFLAGIDEAVKALDGVPKLKKLSPEKRRELVEFVLGNTLFVMAHEMGHALIYEMNMPVLGREEDAADSFALVTALKMGNRFSERVLLEAAKGWVLTATRDKGEQLAFYDEHGLDLQRAYNVVCMMVGSDPEKYGRLAEETKLPEERQKSCVRDYKTTAWSWEEMLKPHLRAPDAPKVAIKIEYQDDPKYALQARILRQMGLLEAFADHAAGRYKWPNPISMVARSCGDPNATWNIGEKTLTLCYELAREFIELFQGYSKKLDRRLKAAARKTR